MRLAGLDARQDPQIRKLLTAARQVSQVSLDIERRNSRPVTHARRPRFRLIGVGKLIRVLVAEFGEVDVLGERQSGKAQFEGAGAGELHRRR